LWVLVTGQRERLLRREAIRIFGKLPFRVETRASRSGSV